MEKGQDKTETIEKKRKPADVPAAVVAALTTLDLATSGVFPAAAITHASIEAAMSMVAGTARSMGVTVEE